jgi:hypothetical protein
MTPNSIITIVIENCMVRLLFFNVMTILILIFDFGFVPTVSFDSPFVRLFGVR